MNTGGQISRFKAGMKVDALCANNVVPNSRNEHTIAVTLGKEERRGNGMERRFSIQPPMRCDKCDTVRNRVSVVIGVIKPKILALRKQRIQDKEGACR